MITSRLKSSAAVLLVKDVRAAADHYRDRLGFAYGNFFGEPPSFCILRRDDCYLMLKQADDPKFIVPHWTVSDKLWDVYFWVTDADGLFEELKDRGAKIDYGPCDQPYGCREFGIQDLDGHDIGFGQVIADATGA
jgi:predicted enzyme related to lactoylglutathione lyase